MRYGISMSSNAWLEIQWYLFAMAVMFGAAQVLRVNEHVRVDLPFACKGGVCGTCRARVTAGAVAMRRNFALEDDELAAGFVLTCQSRPTTDAVTVDYDS